MRRSWLLLILIVLLSCAAEQKQTGKKPVKKLESMALPGWLYQPPAGENFIIGISGKSIYEDQMKDAAKQNAAVMLSRNRSSYTIAKHASTEKETMLGSGSAGFNLNVSSSPEETKRIYQSLQLQHEVFYYGYYLALFSDGKAALNKTHKQCYVAPKPDWYKNDGLQVEGETIYSYASTSSSDLVSAWEKAAEQARLEIAKYIEKNVQGALINRNEQIEKKVAVETREKLSHLRINRAYISSRLYDNLRSYEVILEMTN